MNYWNGDTELEIDNTFERLQKQIGLTGKLEKSCKNPQILSSRIHKSSEENAPWSWIEKFRYLTTLYEMQPQQFQNLSKEELENMKKEFYENQPIILTIPFNMPGAG